MTSIFDEVLSFVRSPEPERFEHLALKVFRYQFDRIAPYREYCLSIGVAAEAVRSLDQVPPVSTVAFKYAELSGGPAERIFLTSGTSVGRSERGRHFVPRLEIYRASAMAHIGRMLFADNRRMPILAIHPTAERMPESSLGQMISWCIEDFGTETSVCAATPQGLEIVRAREFLEAAEHAGEPVGILGTTAACSALFETLRSDGKRIKLPARSRLMDTGGAKGQAQPLDAAAVAELAARWLGIEPALVINEYGMTEMCSQFYDATRFNSAFDAPPGERLKLGPPWVRATALDPVTLAPVENGRLGLLSYFDLANVGSVSALLTEDLGTVERGGIRIIGRTPASEARGCALGIAQFLAQNDLPARAAAERR
ncbi:MAG TPA: hypothetical protein VN742_06175 [Candidatus Binataceae bacterium]|nr:hypothetical protein [Candidatus Binataceae bacterium]